MVTPNSDGINDKFVIKNLVEGLAYPVNQLDIYDKWGSRVFHASNINKEEDFWDPAATNSPAGSYFYRFIGKGYKGNIEHNGVIEVLK
jgi:gliding motility-associated-like protein